MSDYDRARIAVDAGGCAPPIIVGATDAELLACYRSGQIEPDEMIRLCKERPSLAATYGWGLL